MKTRADGPSGGLRLLGWMLLLGGLLALAGCQKDDISTLVTCTPSGRSDVLLVGQTAWGGMTYVQSYLAPYGFTRIDTFDNTAGTPTLAQLKSYDAVMVWTDSPPADPLALGDNLADYLDACGGVVDATFGFFGSVRVTGRYQSGGYPPLTATATNFTVESMGAVPGSWHPVMSGVGPTTAYFHTAAGATSGATVLARWATSGTDMVAVNGRQSVVGIDMYPPDNTAGQMTGDFAKLFANALHFLAGTR